MVLQSARDSLGLARIVPCNDGSALNMGLLGVHTNVILARPGLRVGIDVDAAAASLAAVVMPEMEAVNRNARRPKKVQVKGEMTICSVIVWSSQ